MAPQAPRERPSDKVDAPRCTIVTGNRVYVLVMGYEGILALVMDAMKDLVRLKQAPCIRWPKWQNQPFCAHCASSS